MRKRPDGITLLSIASFGVAAVYLLLLILSFVNLPALVRLTEGASQAARLFLFYSGRYVHFYYGIRVLFAGGAAVGLWKLWDWSRVVLLMAAFLTLMGVFGYFDPFVLGTLFDRILYGTHAVGALTLTVYLGMEQVRRAFQSDGAPLQR